MVSSKPCKMPERRSAIKAKHALILFLGLLWTATLACSLGGAEPTGTPPVVQLMPNLPGYRVVEGQTVQDYIKNLAEGAALLAGNPGMLFLIEKLDSVITCYQEAGAVNMRIYSDEVSPVSSGAIAIADRNRMTDPETLFRCARRGLVPFSSEATVEPCGQSYTLQRDDNEFYIIYVGTTQEICETFCGNLEGCTGQ